MSQITNLCPLINVIVILMGICCVIFEVGFNGRAFYQEGKIQQGPKNSTYRVFVMHCKEPKIPKFNAPTEVLQCKNETNGCNEAIPYIKAIYDWYDKIAEDNFIFVHSHITSWHQSNIEKDVENTTKTEYFRKTG